MNYEAEADGMTSEKLLNSLLTHIESKDKEPIKV
jgi:hypothetical protein